LDLTCPGPRARPRSLLDLATQVTTARMHPRLPSHYCTGVLLSLCFRRLMNLNMRFGWRRAFTCVVRPSSGFGAQAKEPTAGSRPAVVAWLRARAADAQAHKVPGCGRRPGDGGGR
jgi:hypothetical protein